MFSEDTSDNAKGNLLGAKQLRLQDRKQVSLYERLEAQQLRIEELNTLLKNDELLRNNVIDLQKMNANRLAELLKESADLYYGERTSHDIEGGFRKPIWILLLATLEKTIEESKTQGLSFNETLEVLERIINSIEPPQGQEAISLLNDFEAYSNPYQPTAHKLMEDFYKNHNNPTATNITHEQRRRFRALCFEKIHMGRSSLESYIRRLDDKIQVFKVQIEFKEKQQRATSDGEIAELRKKIQIIELRRKRLVALHNTQPESKDLDLCLTIFQGVMDDPNHTPKPTTPNTPRASSTPRAPSTPRGPVTPRTSSIPGKEVPTVTARDNASSRIIRADEYNAGLRSGEELLPYDLLIDRKNKKCFVIIPGTRGDDTKELLLGTGNFGDVAMGFDLMSGTPCAIKIENNQFKPTERAKSKKKFFEKDFRDPVVENDATNEFYIGETLNMSDFQHFETVNATLIKTSKETFTQNPYLQVVTVQRLLEGEDLQKNIAKLNTNLSRNFPRAPAEDPYQGYTLAKIPRASKTQTPLTPSTMYLEIQTNGLKYRFQDGTEKKEGVILYQDLGLDLKKAYDNNKTHFTDAITSSETLKKALFWKIHAQQNPTPHTPRRDTVYDSPFGDLLKKVGPEQDKNRKEAALTLLKHDLVERLKKGVEFLSALEAIHAEHIVHGDIKPKNFQNGKFLDFGTSRRTDDEERLMPSGKSATTGYMAPEYVLSGPNGKYVPKDNRQVKVTEKGDVFSAAVSLFSYGHRDTYKKVCEEREIPYEERKIPYLESGEDFSIDGEVFVPLYNPGNTAAEREKGEGYGLELWDSIQTIAAVDTRFLGIKEKMQALMAHSCHPKDSQRLPTSAEFNQRLQAITREYIHLLGRTESDQQERTVVLDKVADIKIKVDKRDPEDTIKTYLLSTTNSQKPFICKMVEMLDDAEVLDLQVCLGSISEPASKLEVIAPSNQGKNYPLFIAIKEKKTKLFIALIEHLAEDLARQIILGPENTHQDLVYFAAEHNNLPALKAILDKIPIRSIKDLVLGIPPNQSGFIKEPSFNLLEWAVSHNNDAMLDYLLEKCPELTLDHLKPQEEPKKESIFHFCAWSQSPEQFSKIYQKCNGEWDDFRDLAQEEWKNSDGLTPFALLFENNATLVKRIFRSDQSEKNKSDRAAKHAPVVRSKGFLDEALDLRYNPLKLSALQLAFRGNNNDIMSMVLEYTNLPVFNLQDSEDKNPLHYLVENSNLIIIRKLSELLLNETTENREMRAAFVTAITQKDKKGLTPLQYLATSEKPSEENDKIFGFLLDFAPDLNEDGLGFLKPIQIGPEDKVSSIYYAAKNRQNKILESMINKTKNTADLLEALNTKDVDGKNALDYLSRWGESASEPIFRKIINTVKNDSSGSLTEKKRLHARLKELFIGLTYASAAQGDMINRLLEDIEFVTPQSRGGASPRIATPRARTATAADGAAPSTFIAPAPLLARSPHAPTVTPAPAVSSTTPLPVTTLPLTASPPAPVPAAAPVNADKSVEPLVPGFYQSFVKSENTTNQIIDKLSQETGEVQKEVDALIIDERDEGQRADIERRTEEIAKHFEQALDSIRSEIISLFSEHPPAAISEEVKKITVAIEELKKESSERALAVQRLTTEIQKIQPLVEQLETLKAATYQIQADVTSNGAVNAELKEKFNTFSAEVGRLLREIHGALIGEKSLGLDIETIKKLIEAMRQDLTNLLREIIDQNKATGAKIDNLTKKIEPIEGIFSELHKKLGSLANLPADMAAIRTDITKRDVAVQSSLQTLTTTMAGLATKDDLSKVTTSTNDTLRGLVEKVGSLEVVITGLNKRLDTAVTPAHLNALSQRFEAAQKLSTEELKRDLGEKLDGALGKLTVIERKFSELKSENAKAKIEDLGVQLAALQKQIPQTIKGIDQDNKRLNEVKDSAILELTRMFQALQTEVASALAELKSQKPGAASTDADAELETLRKKMDDLVGEIPKIIVKIAEGDEQLRTAMNASIGTLQEELETLIGGLSSTQQGANTLAIQEIGRLRGVIETQKRTIDTLALRSASAAREVIAGFEQSVQISIRRVETALAALGPNILAQAKDAAEQVIQAHKGTLQDLLRSFSSTQAEAAVANEQRLRELLAKFDAIKQRETPPAPPKDPDIAALRSDVVAIAGQLSALQSSIPQIPTNTQSNGTENAELKKEFEAFRTETRQLVQGVHTALSGIGTQLADVSDLKTQMQEMLQAFTELSSKVEENKTAPNIEDLRSTIVSLSGEVRAQKASIDALLAQSPTTVTVPVSSPAINAAIASVQRIAEELPRRFDAALATALATLSAQRAGTQATNATTAIDAFGTQVAGLQRQVTGISQAIAQGDLRANQAIATLKTTVDSIQTQLNTALRSLPSGTQASPQTQELVVLQGQMQVLTDTVEALRAGLSARAPVPPPAAATPSITPADIAKFHRTVEQLTQQSSQRELKAAIREEFAVLKNEIFQKIRGTQTSTDDNAALQTQLDESLARLTSMERRLLEVQSNDAKLRLAVLEAQVAELQGRFPGIIRGIDRNNQQLNASITDLSTRFSELQTQIAAALAELRNPKPGTLSTHAESKIAALKTQMEDLANQFPQIIRKIDQDNQGLNQVTVRAIGELERELQASIESLSSEQRDANARLTREIDSFKREVAAQKGRLDGILRRLDGIERQLSEPPSSAQTTELAALKGELEDLRAEIARSNAGKQTIRQENVALKEQLDDVLTRLTAMQSQLSRTQTSPQASDFDDIREELTRINNELSRINREKPFTGTEDSSLQRKIDDILARLDRIETKPSGAQSPTQVPDLSDLVRQIADLMGAVTELKEGLGALADRPPVPARRNDRRSGRRRRTNNTADDSSTEDDYDEQDRSFDDDEPEIMAGSTRRGRRSRRDKIAGLLGKIRGMQDELEALRAQRAQRAQRAPNAPNTPDPRIDQLTAEIAALRALIEVLQAKPAPVPPGRPPVPSPLPTPTPAGSLTLNPNPAADGPGPSLILPHDSITSGFDLLKRLEKVHGKKTPAVQVNAEKDFSEICLKEIEKIEKMRAILDEKPDEKLKELAPDDSEDTLKQKFNNTLLFEKLNKNPVKGFNKKRVNHTINTAHMYRDITANMDDVDGLQALSIKESKREIIRIAQQDTTTRIAAKDFNAGDKTLLLMVEYARDHSRTGKFKITNCEQNPEAAMKLYVFGVLAKLEPTMDTETMEHIEATYKNKPGLSEAHSALFAVYDAAVANPNNPQAIMSFLEQWKDAVKKEEEAKHQRPSSTHGSI